MNYSYHVFIFIDETPILEYYMDHTLKPKLEDELIDTKIKEVIVNYNLHPTNKICMKQLSIENTVYYEINFEQACLELEEQNINNYSKLEQYFLHFLELFFADTASELVEFLKGLQCISNEFLLEIETDFNEQKSKFFKRNKNRKTIEKTFS